MFRFYTLSQVFFYLVFLVVYKFFFHVEMFFLSYRKEQFFSALFYVTECELNASTEISKI